MNGNPFPIDRSTLRFSTATNPAAGADFTLTVPQSEFWRIVAVTATFTTAAAVANRRPRFTIRQTGVYLMDFPTATDITAGLTTQVTWVQGQVAETGLVNSRLVAPIPEQLWVPATFEIESLTDNIQAADQWSTIIIQYERWKQTSL